MKKEKRIPTILGLLFLLISTVIGVYLTSAKVNFGSKASGDCKPTNVQVTNITHNSLAISFTTSAVCASSLSINAKTILNFTQSSKLHYFSIDNLEESTEYHYSIIINGETFGESSFLVKTAKKPAGTPPIADIAWGKIYNPDKSPGAHSLIYITIPEGSPLSALVTNNGNWNITFANSYNLEKDNWFTPESNLNEDIYVFSQNGQTTQITGNTSRNNPVPDIIIGQNVFFTEETDPQSSGNIDPPISGFHSGKVTILNPKNGETISTLRPDFFGTSDPNLTLSVNLSGPINASGQPISDSTGTWHWSPTSNLISGNYIIRAETTQHSFTVSQNLDQLEYTASDSGDLLIPTPTVTFPSPTSRPTPTTVLAPTSTIAPTPRTYKPSTSSGVPETGVAFPTVFLGIFSISLLVFGFLLI